MLKNIKRGLAVCAAAVSAYGAQAAMTVTFAPTSAGSNAAVTATVAYTGVSALANGTQVVVCYDNTKLTFVSAAYANPPGENQPSQEQAAGSLCVAPANRQVVLSWASVGGTWPSNPTGSGTLAASGNLATINFTTANPFTGSTSAVATENTALGADYGFGTATGTLTQIVVPPTISVARQTGASVADNGTVHTFRVTASEAPLANLTVNLTGGVSGITGAAVGGTTCGSTITILAGQTFADCTRAATNTVPFDGPGTATVTVATGAGYNVAAAPNNTASGSITNDDLPTVTIGPAAANVADNGASQTVTVTLSAAAPAGGFSVPLTALAANARYSGTCVGAASLTVLAGQTTATCTVIGTANTAAGDGSVAANVALNCTSTCTNGATATSVVTVIDDDVPVFNVTCVPTSVADSGATSTCTFRNTLATTAALNVNFTTSANARYTITGCISPLAVPASAANTAVGTCTVTGVANTVPGDGSVVATITPTAGTGYSPGTAGSVTVTDDDVVNVTVTPIGTTEGGNAQFSIACTGPAGAQVTGLTYTIATVAPDAPIAGVQNVGTLTCGTPFIASVPTVNDATQGNARSVTLTLAGPGAVVGGGTPNLPATLAFNAAVADDDRPTVVPTMGVFGLGLLSLLIAGFGALVQRRRK